MHRSYNPYNPVASKLLQKRWDQKHFNDHRKHVVNARSEVDADPPITFMHLHLKLKKLQLEEERLATIERDNRILLEKMSHTMRNKGQLDNRNDASAKSLSRGRREREMLRISRENMELLKRLANKKPAISNERLRRDWEQNLQYMDNISAFPEDWYLNTHQRRARSHSHSLLNKSLDSNKSNNNNNSYNNSNNNAKNKKTKENNSNSKNDNDTEKAKTTDDEQKGYNEDFDEDKN